MHLLYPTKTTRNVSGSLPNASLAVPQPVQNGSDRLRQALLIARVWQKGIAPRSLGLSISPFKARRCVLMRRLLPIGLG